MLHGANAVLGTSRATETANCTIVCVLIMSSDYVSSELNYRIAFHSVRETVPLSIVNGRWNETAGYKNQCGRETDHGDYAAESRGRCQLCRLCLSPSHSSSTPQYRRYKYKAVSYGCRFYLNNICCTWLQRL